MHLTRVCLAETTTGSGWGVLSVVLGCSGMRYYGEGGGGVLNINVHRITADRGRSAVC